MTSETLHFKIGLSSSSDTKKPEFNISINNKVFVDSKLKNNKDEIEYFEFDAEVEEGECFVCVELKNKKLHDTTLDSDGNIVDDLILNIDSIEVDEIDLDVLKWTHSIYEPKYPKHYIIKAQSQGTTLEKTLKNCINLGWNGTWKLPFTSPFYVWLLENI